MSCLEKRENPIIDPEYGFDGVSTSYELLAPISAQDESLLRRSIATAALACEPARKEFVVFELGRLRAMTKARAEDQTSTEFLLACYAEDMRQYPADIVREGCRKWARTEKFFPAWSELKEILDRLSRNRFALYHALRRIQVKRPYAED